MTHVPAERFSCSETQTVPHPHMKTYCHFRLPVSGRSWKQVRHGGGRWVTSSVTKRRQFRLLKAVTQRPLVAKAFTAGHGSSVFHTSC